MTGPGRTVIIGIDSGCWEYIDPLLAAGRMPNLERLIDAGTRGILDSTTPPVTPVAWSSFLTGTNPGKHGLFEWLSNKTGTYAFQPSCGAYRRGIPFWRYLNEAGIRVGVFNIPMTYPPEPIDGFLVSGFDAPSTSRDVTMPATALAWIESRFGPYSCVAADPSTVNSRTYPHLFTTEADHEQRQTSIALALAERYAVDVLMINFMLADHANHYSKDYALVESALESIDSNIGSIMTTFSPSNTIIMSDHGSRRTSGCFLLANWLCDHDYMRFRPILESELASFANLNFAMWEMLQSRGLSGTIEKIVRRSALPLLGALPFKMKRALLPRPVITDYYHRIDYNKTLVYRCNDLGPVYINLQGRNPTGTVVGSAAYAELCRRLIDDLATLRDPENGAPLFPAIYTREQLWDGPFLEQAPDLVTALSPSRWSVLTTPTIPLYESELEYVYPPYFALSPDMFEGNHTSQGIVVTAGSEFAQSDALMQADILDVPATLLKLYGIRTPEYFDGSLMASFKTSAAGAYDVSIVLPDTSARRSGVEDSPYTAEEAAEMELRLRNLGYLE